MSWLTAEHMRILFAGNWQLRHCPRTAAPRAVETPGALELYGTSSEHFHVFIFPQSISEIAAQVFFSLDNLSMLNYLKPVPKSILR